MAEWLSANLEFVLLGLKVTGLIGAFVGFSPEKPIENGESTAAHPNRRRVAFVFLAMAIGAEFCDSLLKRLDSKEQADRFERLAHPLGTIRVTANYTISFLGAEMASYRKRLENARYAATIPVPDPHDDGFADSFYRATPIIYIGIDRAERAAAEATYKEILKKKHYPEKNPYQVPDMSFEVAMSESATAIENIARQRHYSVDFKGAFIHATLGPLANLPDDRALGDSDHSIISTRDLREAKVRIRFCSPQVSGDQNHVMDLEWIVIEFPGQYAINLWPNKENTTWVPAEGNNPCAELSSTLPKTADEWEELKSTSGF